MCCTSQLSAPQLAEITPLENRSIIYQIKDNRSVLEMPGLLQTAEYSVSNFQFLINKKYVSSFMSKTIYLVICQSSVLYYINMMQFPQDIFNIYAIYLSLKFMWYVSSFNTICHQGSLPQFRGKDNSCSNHKWEITWFHSTNE